MQKYFHLSRFISGLTLRASYKSNSACRQLLEPSPSTYELELPLCIIKRIVHHCSARSVSLFNGNYLIFMISNENQL